MWGSGHNLSNPDPFAVSCSSKNPFSDETVWCIVCPSHQVIIILLHTCTLIAHGNVYVHIPQLKNMVSDLFSSGGDTGKTKFFCNKGKHLDGTPLPDYGRGKELNGDS